MRGKVGVMLCVEILDYFVLVNGASVGPIIQGRGIWQGDPFSPYLFIVCWMSFSFNPWSGEM